MKTISKISIILIIIIILAFLDVIVLDIINNMSKEYSIPYNKFQINFNFLDSNIIVLKWSIALIISGIIIFILLGLASRDWKIAVAGILLFATGWEDIFYYLIQLKSIPSQLPWLDYNPLISWVRIFTQTPHVTSIGLVISALFGGILASFIFLLKPAKKKKTRRQ